MIIKLVNITMDKNLLKEMFCISRFVKLAVLWTSLRDCKNTKIVDKKEIENIANKYYELITKYFWNLEKWEDEIEEEYIEKYYYNYSIDELEELINCMKKLAEKYIKEKGCIKVFLAEFIEDWILIDWEWSWKFLEKIKNNIDFQKKLLKILLEGIKNLRKWKRNKFHYWMNMLYKIIWKELPEIESRDVYDYREKFADEYIWDRDIDEIVKEVFRGK